jgi:predicted neuraminidase
LPSLDQPLRFAADCKAVSAESRSGALDLTARLRWGRLCRSPLVNGIWALLEPAGLQNHAPQLAWLDGSTLACVWMAGDGEGIAGMGVHLSLLRRGGRSWTRPRRVSQDATRSEQNPLLYLAEGRLQLIHTAQLCRDPLAAAETGRPFSMQWTARLRHQSRAVGGGRWSRAVDLLPSPAFCRHPPHRRPDGRWLLPIYRSLAEGEGFGADHSEVLLLESDGRYGGTSAPVPDSTGRVHGSIVASADGRSLLQFFRSRLADRIYRAEGSADGLEWTAPVATALPNNNSSIQALRLQSGRLAMIFNRCSVETEPVRSDRWGEAHWPRRRWPLSLALSEDDGLSWPWIRDIDPGWGFCGPANADWNGQLAYPTLVEGEPGELHLAYSWADRLAIRYVALREGDILGLPEQP